MHDLLEEFLSDAADRIGWSPRTIKAYGSHIRGMLTWLTGKLGRPVTANDFTAEYLQMYDTSRKRAGKAQRTRAANVSALQSWSWWMVKRGDITTARNQEIQDGLHVKVTEKPKQRWATTAQVQSLFAACERVGEQHSELLAYREQLCAATLAVMAYGGLRRGELCGLTTSDVDLLAEVPTLTVRHGKGDKSRVVWLHPAAARYVKVWIEHRPIDDPQLFAVPVYRLGRSVEVAPMKPGRLTGILRELCRIAEIKDAVGLAPHAFRRFAATKLLEVPGCTLAHVRDFLGHSQITTTMRYVGVEAQQLQAFVSAMAVEPPKPPAPAPHATERRPVTKQRQMMPSLPRKASYRRT